MVIYQIYPRSFLDTNGDGVGDLNGITEKLGYIRDLGADAIWISPFFASPMKDFGYDISDHCAVDPIFGSMEDFRRLVARARQLSLKVLIDLVASHTSDQHPWFAESVRRSGPKDDWYIWAEPKPDGSPPNNWLSVFGGPAWRWHPQRRQYFYHSFLPSQPDLQLHNPAVQDALLGVMRFWLNEGIAGFRLDACNHYFQDLRLRDNPAKTDTSAALHPYGFQVHEFDQGRPEVVPFLARVRGVLDELGAFSVGEVGGTDPVALMGEYTGPRALHSAYSFALMRKDNSAAYIRGVIEQVRASVRHPAIPCYAFSNHDKPRVVSRWGKDRHPAEVARLYLALLLSLPGHICLYQGEELGLPEVDVPFDRLQDPYGKEFWPVFKGRDGARTPMPWSHREHAGFSTHKPWLPIPPSHFRLNVEDQLGDTGSVLNFATRALAARREHEALSAGTLTFIELGAEILCFERRTEESSVTCVFNLGASERTVALAAGRAILSQNAVQNGPEYRLGVNGFCVLSKV